MVATWIDGSEYREPGHDDLVSAHRQQRPGTGCSMRDDDREALSELADQGSQPPRDLGIAAAGLEHQVEMGDIADQTELVIQRPHNVVTHPREVRGPVH